MLIDLVFFKDMCMQFFLAYPDEEQGNHLVTSLPLIRKNYRRNGFAIDLASIFPFGPLATWLMRDDGQDGAAGILRVVRLLKLIKLLRLLRSSRIFQRWECELAIPAANIALM